MGNEILFYACEERFPFRLSPMMIDTVRFLLTFNNERGSPLTCKVSWDPGNSSLDG